MKLKIDKIILFFNTCFIALFIAFISININAYTIDNGQSADYEAFIFTFVKGSDVDRDRVLSLSEYDVDFTAYDLTIYYRGSEIYNFEYTFDFVSFYVQYTYNTYNLVIFESANFQLNNVSDEIWRGILQTQATERDITLNIDNNNFFSVLAFNGTFYDDINTLSNYLNQAYNNSFNELTQYYYTTGYDNGYYDGSQININDYIKKDDATSWITGIFEAFGDFFSIRLGPVSIGAIILMPVSISIVWFIIRMFRGGGGD